MNFLLSNILINPSHARNLDFVQFGQLVRQARSTNLLATLALRLQDAAIFAEIPPVVRRHLESAVIVHTKQKNDLDYNIKQLRKALSAVGQKLVLLKGAAYLQADVLAASGRLMSDIDIIVPERAIQATENSLNQAGWESAKLDPYNERYYRKWMHEIPPMGHRKHGSTLDLHFTILPPTARANIDARLLFEQVVEVRPKTYTLCPQDMVIHSATHLFHEGEFRHGLRDLWDLDRMLRDFSAKDIQFWETLVSRARALDLITPLFHGLNYTQQVFATPVPPTVMASAASWPRRLRRPLMDFLFLRAFRPDQPECRLPFTGVALNLLYIRSHYLRMPLYLLLPHLARKAWMARFGNTAEASAATKTTT